jgi:hypothetical protein
LDILKPLVDRIRFEGPEFLAKNIHLAQEVRRTLEDLDKIDEDLKKAERNIESAREKLSTYCSRIQTLCAAPLEQATTQA